MPTFDFPVFYLASKDLENEHWWGFTGYPDSIHGKYPRHKVLFTREFLDHLCWLELGDRGGYWDLVPNQESIYLGAQWGFQDWTIKWDPPHMDGYVWKLQRLEDMGGYVLGVWPD